MANDSYKVKKLKKRVEELEAKIEILQRSTKTSFLQFEKPHNILRAKFNWYNKWHLRTDAGRIHIEVLILYILLASLFLLYIVFAPPHKTTRAAGNIYYVATNGSDSNPGTEVQSFLTVQKGIDAVSTGDTILVRGGVYNENPNINNKTNIILKNYPGEMPIVRGENETYRYGIFSIGSSASYITLEGFTIDEKMIPQRYDGSFINGIQIRGSHNTIRNMTIKGSPERVNPPTYNNFYPKDTDTVPTAISISGGASYNLIEGNTITDIHQYRGSSLGRTYYGFGINNGGKSHYNIIRGNTVLRVHNASIYIGNSGASQQSDVQHDIIIENNILGDSVQEDGIHFDGGYFPDWPIHNIIVRNNHIYNHPENGIDLKGTKDIEIYGNVIHGCPGNDDAGMWDDAGNNFLGGVGGIMHGSGTISSDVSIYNNVIYDNNGGILAENGYKIFNNVIYENNRIYTGSNSTYDWTRKPLFSGIKMENGPMTVGGNYIDVVIKNNIISGHRHGEIALKGSVAGNTDINNNLYFDYIDPVTKQNMGTRLVEFTDKYNWGYTDFTGWKTYLQGLSGVIGKGLNSLTADPKFVDFTNHNYKLQANSPAINAGISSGAPTADKEGNPRVGAVDIGAYEYDSTLLEGYVLDGWGGIHPFGGVSLDSDSSFPYWKHWDIARDIVVRSDGQSGYVLDGFGGVHPFGGAPAISNTSPYWGWDIARRIELVDDTSGYVLDGFGGIHPFGGATPVSITAYWPFWDIALDFDVRADGKSGYVLDGFGGIHPFGEAPVISDKSPYWGWDIARRIELASDTSGYVLDGWGGIHPFGGASLDSGPSSPYWKYWDIARDFDIRSDGKNGYVLDGFGGIHAFGGVPAISNSSPYWGWDIARMIRLAE